MRRVDIRYATLFHTRRFSLLFNIFSIFSDEQKSQSPFMPSHDDEYNLLATVDSLELHAHHSKHLTTQSLANPSAQNTNSSATSSKNNFSTDNFQLMLRKLPPYMTRSSLPASVFASREVHGVTRRKNTDELVARQNQQQRRQSSSVRFSDESLPLPDNTTHRLNHVVARSFVSQ